MGVHIHIITNKKEKNDNKNNEHIRHHSGNSDATISIWLSKNPTTNNLYRVPRNKSIHVQRRFRKFPRCMPSNIHDNNDILCHTNNNMDSSNILNTKSNKRTNIIN